MNMNELAGEMSEAIKRVKNKEMSPGDANAVSTMCREILRQQQFKMKVLDKLDLKPDGDMKAFVGLNA